MLARKSGESAKEIADIIQQSLLDVQNLVEKNKTRAADLVKNSKDRLSAGLEVADQCRQIFEVIVTKTQESNRMSSEISRASEEQSKGAADIAEALASLEALNNKNRTMIQSTKSQSDDLAIKGEGLQKIVHRLEAIINIQTEKTSALDENGESLSEAPVKKAA